MRPLYVLLLAIGLSSANPVLIDYLQSQGRDISADILEDARLSTLELVKKYGYNGEEHIVQTEDGYILALHRVLPAKGCSGKPKVILVQHGLLSSSADWVVMGPGKAFAYLLSDACFDVWLGNSRGNTYSRNHSRLDNKSPEYWDFSWHEMALYDLPTVIDYILIKTDNENLIYAGHSQGTTQFFIFNSLKPEYKDKIRAMFALAPIAFLGNSQSTLMKLIAKFDGILEWITSNLGINEFLPSTELIQNVGGTLCNDEHPNSQNICSNLLFAICGYDAPQTNGTMLPVILGHAPAGSATKQFLHYAQLLNSGKFQMFDYGSKENKIRYGQKTPPDYPLEKAETMISLWYSNNDYFANVKDVDTLFTKLKNPLGKFLVPWDQFNHLDYLWAIDANKFVYEPIIATLNRL